MHATKNSKQTLRKGTLTSLVFGEAPVLANVVAEVTTRHQVNDKVKVLLVFKGIVHVDQEPKNSMMVGYWHEGKLTNDATDKGISFRS